MGRERKTNFVRMKVWTEVMTVDMEGTIAACCIRLFAATPVETQAILLEKLKASHEVKLKKKGGAS